MSGPAALVVPSVKRHTASVIMAHGLGDSGSGWVGLAENWRKRGKFDNVAFVFPNAPTIPITVNFGIRMPGWYDIKNFSTLSQDQDEPGILRSRDYLNSLIKAEIEKGVPSTRIIIGGFSQGGAMSLLTGITSQEKLGGIFGLSSYLLLKDRVQGMLSPQNPNKNTPIFMGHGDLDPLVQYEWAKETADTLKRWGWNVDLHTYSGLDHSANPLEIEELETYINERLRANDGSSQTSV